MSLKIKVKAGNISHLTDARYFSAMLVDYLGFPVDKMSTLQIRELVPWLSGPEMVLEFSATADMKSIFTYMAETELKTIQLPYDTELEIEDDLKVIYTYSIDSELEWEKIKMAIEGNTNALYHLINFSNKNYEWLLSQETILRDLSDMHSAYPLMLDIALTEEEVVAFYNRFSDIALHLQGSEEEKVGQKAYDLMDAILENLGE